jgi:hypothetical protein
MMLNSNHGSTYQVRTKTGKLTDKSILPTNSLYFAKSSLAVANMSVCAYKDPLCIVFGKKNVTRYRT